VAVVRPTPTRGATAPLFFAFAPENNFELDSIFFVAAFQNLAWFLISNLVNANAKDRKRIERTRSQKAAKKK